MQETIENVLALVRGGVRFRWWGLLCAWIMAVAGWAVVSVLPNVYESRAQVYVDTDSLLSPLLSGIAADAIDFNERLGLMTKELISRPVLERVVREVGLDLDATSPAELDAILFELEAQVNVNATRTHRSVYPEAPNLYILSARNEDPQKAHDIVRSLLNIFVEDSLGGSRQEADYAQSFLLQQLTEYEGRLLEAESRLEEFKRDNIEYLPDQEATYYQRLQSARAALEDVELELREEEFRRSTLQEQLQGISPFQSASGAVGEVVGSSLNERINALQRSLDNLLLTFTEEYPEVRETRRTLETLMRQRDEEVESLRRGDSIDSSNNPLYQEIRVAIGTVDSNIAALSVRQEEFRANVSSLQEQIGVLPEVERKLLSLNRDYEVNKDSYDTLLQRLEAARMREQVDETGEDVQFKIIDPPSLPNSPVYPNRLLFGTGALIAALGVGAALCLLLGQLFPVFTGSKDLDRHFGIPVIGVVSSNLAASAVRDQRLSHVVYVFGGLLLAAAYVGMMYVYLNGFSLPLGG
jgi:polysaccharide chain length determinant protein (PEP-CTERM system associated)